MGARILQVGGVEKVFMQLFSVREGEKLLKASQCYLSTTSGPIAGLLFISTHKVAFCSDRSIKISSPNGEDVRVHYKVNFFLIIFIVSSLCKCFLAISLIFLHTFADMYFNFYAISGLNSPYKIKVCQQKSECGEAFTKVHRNSNCG